MTQASFGDGIKLEQVSQIELGGEGVRVTFVDGQRRFVEGEIGFDSAYHRLDHLIEHCELPTAIFRLGW